MPAACGATMPMDAHNDATEPTTEMVMSRGWSFELKELFQDDLVMYPCILWCQAIAWFTSARLAAINVRLSQAQVGGSTFVNGDWRPCHAQLHLSTEHA